MTRAGGNWRDFWRLVEERIPPEPDGSDPHRRREHDGDTRAVQPRQVANQVGAPKQDDFATADTIQNRIPPLLLEAARAQRSADRVIYALLLDGDAAIRQRQLAMIVAHAGAESESETLLMRQAVDALHPMQRMPLAASYGCGVPVASHVGDLMR